MKTRKPNLKDRIFGCIEWVKVLLKGFMKGQDVSFAKWMLMETLKGNFEVVMEEEEVN